MRIPFTGLEIGRTKAVTSVTATGQLHSVNDRGAGGWFRILESFAGAWQQNTEITVANVTTHPIVFACTTLIAGDISKMRIRLVQQDSNGIWSETDNPAFSPVLRKPNHYQNRIQFNASWMFSKLFYGNTYVLKVRDNRRVVVDEHVLDPCRVRPLVAPNGEVFYELKRDDLSFLPLGAYTVPASEIIHDRWNTFFHPLVGLSPIYACGLAAIQGLNIQNNSTNFFGNGSLPGGVLTAPGFIHQETADRLKAYFDDNFTGDNAGKVAVMGDGLKYERMSMSATDSQLIEQLKWSDEVICSVFHVPAWLVGVGPMPANNNVQALWQMYYAQCLQSPIEAIELCQDEGLNLPTGLGTEFDLDDLLRMDSLTMMDMLERGRNYLTPNDGRKKLGLPDVVGGNVVLRQQQDFSLEALSKRDAKADPFGKPEPAAPATPPKADASADPQVNDLAKEAAAMMRELLQLEAA